ncbi:MAG TPA: NADP-dependent oxidoreductase, partial [Burkholderiales bacterium]|nr:NADP-dependent oxidoreductase [Burkholderiales bacterium]
GQFLVRNRWLSLDPYMRGRMDAKKSYAKHVELGEVMVGGAVGEVIESRHPAFKPGDFVNGAFGWQEYALSDGAGARKVDPSRAPLSYYLGVLGMPGVTAWMGLLDIAQPKAGETVVVSAASGAVGSVVGQLARIKGCRAVGIAGGRAKCDYTVGELGFDACADYKAGDLGESLQAAAPKGVDVHFENVGGEVLDAVLAAMNPFSRITICGLVSQYNATEPYGVRNFRSILTNRIRVQGFIVSDRMELWPRALDELAGWIAEGKIRYRETVARGLANAPRAFIGMLRGDNLGKQLVALD